MSQAHAPAADAPPPLLAIVFLSLAAGASAMGMRINDALLPQLSQLFGTPLATTAQVVSLYALAYGATQVLWGPVGDRFGKYRVVGAEARPGLGSAEVVPRAAEAGKRLVGPMPVAELERRVRAAR